MIRRREGRASGRIFELRFETGSMYHPRFRMLFSDEIVGGWSYAVGRIFLGPVHAPFEASLEYWEPADYERQWRAAAERVADGAPGALFLTSYRGPGASNHSAWRAQRDGNQVEFGFGIVSAKHLDAYMHTAPAHSRRWPTFPASPRPRWAVSVWDIREFLAFGPTSGSHVPA